MLKNGPGPSRLRGNPLHFAPIVAATFRFVYTTTSRSDNVVGISRVDINSEDVGVIYDAVSDGLPGLPTISRFVRQIPGAGIHDIGRSRINCQRLDVN